MALRKKSPPARVAPPLLPLANDRAALAHATALLRAARAPLAIVGVSDFDGGLRGKYMRREDCAAALKSDFSMSDILLGWDIEDRIYDAPLTGAHTGFPDSPCVVAAASGRLLPQRQTPFFLGEFAGRMAAVDPRAALRRVLARVAKAGFAPVAACEFEFALFAETAAVAKRKHSRDLTPWIDGYFSNSTSRLVCDEDFYSDFADFCEGLRIPIASLHIESGPCVEAAIRHSEALEAADRGAIFKNLIKSFAARRGLLASFMAKPLADRQGNGQHLHLSFWRRGKNAFFDARRADGASDILRHAVGGMQAALPQLTVLFAPTVNSYRRFAGGDFAPKSAHWGFDNRVCALRAIGGGAAAQRIECRAAGADANSHLVTAAALGAAIWGIENKIEPGPPTSGELPADSRLDFPVDLRRAVAAFRGGDIARDLFGDAFVDHFAAGREWEARQFDGAVTDWEIARYLESA